jgi:hypothetical protein
MNELLLTLFDICQQHIKWQILGVLECGSESYYLSEHFGHNESDSNERK